MAYFSNGDYARAHKCMYQLSKIVFRDIYQNTFSTFQKQAIEFQNMSNPLSQSILKTLEERSVETFPIPGFRHNRPKPLGTFGGQCETVGRAFCTVWPELGSSVQEEIGKYHHSSMEKDLAKQAEGFTVLVEKPQLDHDFEDFYVMFVRTALEGARVPLHENEAITPATMMSQQVTGSSSGLLPMCTIFGGALGSKKEMQAAATSVNVMDADLPVPGCLPAKPSAKDEVIKKGKKVRTIMVESESNFLVLKHFCEDFVTRTQDIARGEGIGMSTLNGGYKVIFMRWYWVYLQYHPRDNWHDFLNWVEKQKADESDKTAWESSTNMVDGMCFLFELLFTIADLPDPVSKKLMSRALADFANPPVQIDADKVYFAPWRVLSGSYFTAKGNTKRHRYMVSWVCDFIEMHDMRAGDEKCVCRWCPRLKHLEKFGTAFSPQQLDMIRASFILGDDFIALNDNCVFGKILDEVFGTTTKTHFKPVFSKSGLFEPDGCEFLKRHFFLDRQFSTWNVRSFRAPGRLLAKLFHGRSSASGDTFKAALLSAVWECGYNRPLYEVLKILWNEIEVKDPAVFNRKLDEFVKRTPAVAGSTTTWLPEFATIINADASLIRPLEKVYWAMKIDREVGLPAGVY